MVRTREALKAARFPSEAAMIEAVAADKGEWETYARKTFEAHVRVAAKGKLRFLQYVTPDTLAWWSSRASDGAVLLGKLAHG